MKLTGKVALITGGTNGIGKAIATRFHAEAAQVVVTGTKRAYGLPYNSLISDAGSLGDIARLIGGLPPLDILVVNAGIAIRSRISQITEADYDEQMRINTKGPLFLLQAAIPKMRAGGSIILISSVVATRGTPDLVIYGASKAALRSMGLSLSMELAGRGIRVNTITPAGISTALKDADGEARRHHASRSLSRKSTRHSRGDRCCGALSCVRRV